MASDTSPNAPAGVRSTDQELSILTEIGQILSSSLDLRSGFGQVMQIISDKLSMRRGALIMLDESTGRLRTEAAIGLTPEEIERAFRDAFVTLGRRINLFLSLPLASLDTLGIKKEMDRIGKQ